MPATSTTDAPAEERITEAIAELDDWRGATLARVRELVHEADPDVVEEVKWVKPSNPTGVPTWTHDGIICTGEVYKANVKLTFFSGAALDDPDRPLHLEPRRRHEARHRPRRGRRPRRRRVPSPRASGRRPQHRPGLTFATTLSREVQSALADHPQRRWARRHLAADGALDR